MEERAPSSTESSSKRTFGYAWAVACVLVSLLFAWQWYDSRLRIDELRGELAQKVRDSEAESRDARLSAKQAQEAMREALAKVAQLDLRLSEYQNHQSNLEALYQELSHSRDEWVVAEIEQVLVI